MDIPEEVDAWADGLRDLAVAQVEALPVEWRDEALKQLSAALYCVDDWEEFAAQEPPPTHIADPYYDAYADPASPKFTGKR